MVAVVVVVECVSLISPAPLQDMCGLCGVTGPLAGLVLADLSSQVQRELEPLLLPLLLHTSFYLDNLN